MSGIWDKLVIQCLLVVYREYRTRDLIFHNYYVPDKIKFRNTDDYSQYVSDNGKKIYNHGMKHYCFQNGTKIAHQSPRTPMTQGLLESANRMWKENTRYNAYN